MIKISTASNRRMTALMKALIATEGNHPSPIPGVTLMRADRSKPRVSVFQEPTIVIVGQGRKRGHVGGRAYDYGVHQCLIISVPMHFDCETEVTPGKPMLAVAIQIDTAVVSELLFKLGRAAQVPIKIGQPQGMTVTRLDEALGAAVVRLLEILASPADARLLGSQTLREIFYRVLCGEGGHALRSLVTHEGELDRIHRTIIRIQTDYSKPLDIAKLAREAGMSSSVFHRSFKSVTGSTPMQFLKNTRLHKAMELMVLHGERAASAAYRVGYASASQFSREFKRLFGATPAEELARVRDKDK